LIYYLAFGVILGQVLFPVWFFQGMEKMKYITFLNIFARIIFTISIFIFVKNASDFLYVPILSSLGSIVAGVLAFWIVFKDFGVKFRMPDFERVKFDLKEGWYIFISTVAISLYTTSNTFILGLFTNNIIVGYYSAAEKIIRSAQGLLSPVSQTIFPHVSKLMNESKDAGIKFIRRITYLIGGLSFVISLVIFILANLIVGTILGSQYTESIIILRILAFLPFLVGLSNVFGIQTMLTLNYKKAFTNIIVFASGVNIFLAIILVPLYNNIGTSISVLITEMIITISMFLFLESKGIKILGVKNV
jgi:PST family polysaccharide transporter